jgi:hypothetical protein
MLVTIFYIEHNSKSAKTVIAFGDNWTQNITEIFSISVVAFGDNPSTFSLHRTTHAHSISLSSL